jgi:GntR family transcriptional regulator
MHVLASAKLATKAAEKQLPAYRRIAAELTRRIDAGKLRQGDAVPSERELAAEFAVSLMTARHALQEMTADGLLSRRPNVGTFVAPPRIHFNKLTSFTEEMLGRGLAPQSRILTAVLTTREDEVCSRLSLPAGTELVCIERLRLSGKDPFSIESCYLPASRFGGILQQHLERKSLFSTLAGLYGVTLSYADEEIDATSADARTSRLLAVRLGSPILRIRQVLYGQAEPIIYCAALYRSDRHSLLIRRFR